MSRVLAWQTVNRLRGVGRVLTFVGSAAALLLAALVAAAWVRGQFALDTFRLEWESHRGAHVFRSFALTVHRNHLALFVTRRVDERPIVNRWFGRHHDQRRWTHERDSRPAHYQYPGPASAW